MGIKRDLHLNKSTSHMHNGTIKVITNIRRYENDLIDFKTLILHLFFLFFECFFGMVDRICLMLSFITI